MKIFLDTANINEIKEMSEFGLVDGITTNPTLLAKEGKDSIKVLKDIIKVVGGPVNVEPIGLEAKDILKEAEEYSSLGKNVVIKLAFTKEAIKAANVLIKKNIKVNFTLIFSVSQAIVAAKVKADYVTPFVGRLDDGGQYGTGMVSNIVKVYKNYNIKTQIIAASIRTTLHVVELALAGADIVTVPKNVLELMIKHPLTDLGIKKFIEDWKKKQ